MNPPSLTTHLPIPTITFYLPQFLASYCFTRGASSSRSCIDRLTAELIFQADPNEQFAVVRETGSIDSSGSRLYWCYAPESWNSFWKPKYLADLAANLAITRQRARQQVSMQLQVAIMEQMGVDKETAELMANIMIFNRDILKSKKLGVTVDPSIYE